MSSDMTWSSSKLYHGLPCTVSRQLYCIKATVHTWLARKPQQRSLSATKSIVPRLVLKIEHICLWCYPHARTMNIINSMTLHCALHRQFARLHCRNSREECNTWTAKNNSYYSIETEFPMICACLTSFKETKSEFPETISTGIYLPH